ncbi:MAG: hypothetical protein RI903_385 [Bacteroidota bacterium]
MINLKTFKPETHLRGLMQYLMDNEKLADIKIYDEKLMSIRTDQVLDQIQKGPGDWENAVPESVVKQIKENALFGYQKS